jgi:N-acetylneuraminic acid mutarotase
LEREKRQAVQEKERELGLVNQQLEESERLITDFSKRNRELEEERRVLRSQVQGGVKAGAVSRTDFKLRWREGEKAPRKMLEYCNAVLGNNTVYCMYGVDEVYSYHIPSSNWSPVTNCPAKGFCVTVIDGLLTTVGGFIRGKNTNKLFSLTGEGSGRRWTEKFPPMPTKRFDVSALCTGTTLIVAGGWGDCGDGDDRVLKKVEVLNTETREWHTAANLPQPLDQVAIGSSIALCGDLVYLLGGFNKDHHPVNSVYSCSLISLLSSTGSTSLGGRLVSTLTRSSKGSPWNRVADLPAAVKFTTAVSLHGRLLAIGGHDLEGKPTTAVHMYQPTTDSWEVISHMTTPRTLCFSTVLPDNQLMVVGGWIARDKVGDSTEFGTVF